VRPRGLVLRAACDENCVMAASARLTVPGTSRTVKLRQTRRSLAAGAKTRLKLRTSRTVLKKLRRAFRHRSRLTARISVTAKDAAGNRSSAKRKIRARR
jgi:hypothetical protein